MQFSAILITLGASLVAAAPSTPEKRQFEGLFGGGSRGFSLCTTDFQTAQCCDTSIDGVLNLNCHASVYGLHSTKELVASCHHGGQKAYCCAVSLAGVGMLCEEQREEQKEHKWHKGHKDDE